MIFFLSSLLMSYEIITIKGKQYELVPVGSPVDSEPEHLVGQGFYDPKKNQDSFVKAVNGEAMLWDHSHYLHKETVRQGNSYPTRKAAEAAAALDAHIAKVGIPRIGVGYWYISSELDKWYNIKYHNNDRIDLIEAKRAGTIMPIDCTELDRAHRTLLLREYYQHCIEPDEYWQ